jgi:hypothetical protein
LVGVVYLSQEDHAVTRGAAKRRDIARSVLPSTCRKRAHEDLAALRRQSRRSVRQNLAAIVRPGGEDAVLDAFDGTAADLRSYPDAQIRLAVFERRGGDKLGPLLRWGRSVTVHLPRDERLDAVRRLFDDNLVGRHAVAHLAWDEHFRVEHDHQRASWRSSDGAAIGLGDVAARLRAVAADALARGEHADLNYWMKAHPSNDGLVRVLAGLHDLERFGAACARIAAWRDAVDAFGSP